MSGTLSESQFSTISINKSICCGQGDDRKLFKLINSTPGIYQNGKSLFSSLN